MRCTKSTLAVVLSASLANCQIASVTAFLPNSPSNRPQYSQISYATGDLYPQNAPFDRLPQPQGPYSSPIAPNPQNRPSNRPQLPQNGQQPQFQQPQFQQNPPPYRPPPPQNPFSTPGANPRDPQSNRPQYPQIPFSTPPPNPLTIAAPPPRPKNTPPPRPKEGPKGTSFPEPPPYSPKPLPSFPLAQPPPQAPSSSYSYTPRPRVSPSQSGSFPTQAPSENGGRSILCGSNRPGCPEGQYCYDANRDKVVFTSDANANGICYGSTCSRSNPCPDDQVCGEGKCLNRNLDCGFLGDECPEEPGWRCIGSRGGLSKGHCGFSSSKRSGSRSGD